jgi:hypothetical protein
MSKRIAVTAVMLLFLLAVSAQKKMNYVEVDKVSYELFQQQKWDELIDYSAEARKQGIDFFYLQVRTGIAYYNLKKYRISSEWFLKAWKNDQSFEWLQEYLYYSLVYAGRTGEATKLASQFTPLMQNKVAFKKSKLTRIALEGGYTFNPDFDQLKELNLAEEANLGDNYGEAYFLKNYHFESFDLNHQISPSFYLNHNFTFLSSNREEQVDWGQRYSFPVKTNQFQYFINPMFVAGKKLFVSPSLSALWGNSEYYVGDLGYNQDFSDFIFSTSLWSNFGNFSPGAEINLANINDESFTQMSAWLTIYPFSNANFYVTPRVYLKSDSETSLKYNTFGVSGGAKLGPVHFYGQYLVGDMENFVEAAGYVISNFPGSSDSKFMGSLHFPFAKKYQFVLRYINQNITETYRVYTSGIESGSTNYNFTKHTLTAGLSWNF